MNAIGKILPIDGYYVVMEQKPSIDFNASLTHFYQPLIGIQALSLYYTLYYEVGFQKHSQTHHTLMAYLNLTLDEIYRSRLKLEAIGLLKTYKRIENNQDFYTYSIQSPYSPNQFFKEPMLSQLLLHHIGEQKYNELYSHYMRDNFHYGEEVTVDFKDVFETVTPKKQADQTQTISETGHEAVDLMDFTFLEHALRQRFIPVDKVLSKPNKQLIYQMKVLYDLGSMDLEKAVQWALNEDNQLNQEEFKSACHDIFSSQNNGRAIRLQEKVKPETKIAKAKPVTKEEQLIYELETISPKQLLEDLSDGNQASEQDIKVVREVMTRQGLPSPVMNVLIHYVLLQSNMKLSKAYMETIASHWSRVGIKTAKEAMDFAKQEQSKYKTNQNKPRNSTSYTRNKNTSGEVVPDWFKKRKKKQPEQVKTTSNKEISQQEIADRLHKYLNES